VSALDVGLGNCYFMIERSHSTRIEGCQHVKEVVN
jgi:hypothetical protein